MNTSFSPPPVEDLIIVAFLVTTSAVVTIASAVLQLLVGPRLRPADGDPLEPFDGGDDELEELEAAMEEALPSATYPVITCQPDKPAPARLTTADALAHVPLSTLRRMCEKAGLDATGTRCQLRERLLDHNIDLLNDPGPESLTASQRNRAGGEL